MSEKPKLPDDLIAEIERLAPQLMAIDHYGVLGVTEKASAAEIEAAYLRAMNRFHPDRWATRELGAHQKRMEAIFSRAAEAYEVLRDPDTKLDYDRSLYAVRGIPRASSLPQPPPKPAIRAPSALELAAAVRLMNQAKGGAPPAVRVAPSPPAAPAPVPPAPPAPTASGKPRPRIVVAEDDETLRRMVMRVLAELGDCEGAADGASALALVQTGALPSLVVTDVMMPTMDGLELARRLKKDAKTARIPIVMLTAKTSPKEMIEGVNAGARYYVNKPFKVEELKSRVKKALGLP